MARYHIIAIPMLAAATAGCMTTLTQSAHGDAHPSAGATLMDARGQEVANVEIGDEGGELYVAIDVSRLPPGRYAAHIHAVGRCDAPSFASAGPHWNPTNAQHGVHSEQGAHMGDLPNIAVNAQGRGLMGFQLQGSSLRTGPNALLDADGASVVIHAREDDYLTDPSGNSGDRIACGVLRMAG